MKTVESIQHAIHLNIKRAENSLRDSDYSLASSQLKTARLLLNKLITLLPK